MTIWRRRSILLLLALGALAQTGCITRWLGMGGEPEVEGARGSVPIAKVERMLDTFADRLEDRDAVRKLFDEATRAKSSCL